MKRKILSTLLSVCLIATMFAAFGITASAAKSSFDVTYDTQGGSQITATTATGVYDYFTFGQFWSNYCHYDSQVGSYYKWYFLGMSINPATGKQDKEYIYTLDRYPTTSSKLYNDTNGTQHSSSEPISGVYYAYTATVTSAQPTRTDYTFAGWNTSADGTGTSYAADATLDNATTLFAQWTADVTANDFATTPDSGYYAEAADSETMSGAVAFNAFFDEFAKYENDIDTFGLYIYNPLDETKNASLTSADVAALTAAEGYFFGTVEGIDTANFNDFVVAKPYVVIGGATYYGNAVERSVFTDGAAKWLGAKTAE